MDSLDHPQYTYHSYENQIDVQRDPAHVLVDNDFSFVVYSETKPRANIALFSVYQISGTYK